jgi:hypothetical protein
VKIFVEIYSRSVLFASTWTSCIAISLIAFVSGQGNSIFSATIASTDTSQASLQAAINRASDGDTVMVPTGSSTWTSRVYISKKAITILGAGIGQTIITSALPTRRESAPFYVSSGGKAVRISGFSCVGGPGDQAGFINMSSQNFRIDHCAFSNLTKRGVAAYSTANSSGVIDHCTFNKAGGSMQGVSVFGDGDGSWNRPLSLGSDQAVYIEDCTFNYGGNAADGAFDAYGGARLVFRHNVVNNTSVGLHGLDSGGYRSPVSWEIYDNTFNTNIALARWMFFRGGTGVVFNNKIQVTGNVTVNNIQLAYYRATAKCSVPGYKPWGFVTGSNPYDGNTDGYGYPALDQTGAAPPTTPEDISSKPPASRSVQGRSAAYAWNNVMIRNGGTPTEVKMTVWQPSGACMPACTTGAPCPQNLIKEGRDFVNGTAKPGYTPLTYPHPLRSSSPQSLPTASAAPSATLGSPHKHYNSKKKQKKTQRGKWPSAKKNPANEMSE